MRRSHTLFLPGAMSGSSARRRFYQLFFRWNDSVASQKHVARHCSRPFSSSSAAAAADSSEPTRPPITIRHTTSRRRAKKAEQDEKQLIWRPFEGEHTMPKNFDQYGVEASGAEESRVEESRLIRQVRFTRRAPSQMQLLKERTRSAFRSVTQPVAVITALAAGPSSAGEDGSYNPLQDARAMTVSSLNTVSLDPPVISLNIRLPSSTWDAIKQQHRFRVHVLRATEHGQRIAESFAKNDAEAGFLRQLALGTRVSFHRPGRCTKYIRGTQIDKEETGNINPNPAPSLRHDAIAFAISAVLRPQSCVLVNDHILVIADVENVSNMTPSVLRDKGKPREPLLSYFNNDFVTGIKKVRDVKSQPPRFRRVPIGTAGEKSEEAVSDQKEQNEDLVGGRLQTATEMFKEFGEATDSNEEKSSLSIDKKEGGV